MWVQLTTTKQIEIAGVPRTFHRGDWVNVGKQTAHLFLSSGDAVLYSATDKKELSMSGATIVAQGNPNVADKILHGMDANVVFADPHIPTPKAVIWDTGANVRTVLFSIGLSLLDTWEMAVPLWDYRMLAVHIGDTADQEKTKAIIHDLRVPLYDCRLIFARKTPDTEKVIGLWQADQGGDTRLSFLRAVYQVKPFILALPANWSGHDAPG